jgi:hypothetical protein
MLVDIAEEGIGDVELLDRVFGAMRLFEPREDGAEPRNVLGFGDGGELIHHLASQQRPNLVQLGDLALAQFGDRRTAVGHELDEPFRLERAQRFAQRGAADAQLRA